MNERAFACANVHDRSRSNTLNAHCEFTQIQTPTQTYFHSYTSCMHTNIHKHRDTRTSTNTKQFAYFCVILLLRTLTSRALAFLTLTLFSSLHEDASGGSVV